MLPVVCRRIYVLFVVCVSLWIALFYYMSSRSQHSGVQQVLCCVLVLFVLCALCCKFLWIVNFWLPLRYSLTFIYLHLFWDCLKLCVEIAEILNKCNAEIISLLHIIRRCLISPLIYSLFLSSYISIIVDLLDKTHGVSYIY